MSKETLEHLNTNVLIGNTDHRGTAWHWRADLLGDEPNHYPGPIPVEDVRRRLFNWHAVSRPIAVEVLAEVATFSHFNQESVRSRWEVIPDRQAIVRSDTDHVMGIFTAGYEMHQYDRWLVDTVANVLDDDLSISSAGLLRQGAIAWVEVSVPKSITTPEGVEFRPNLLATTSFDGSCATTFKRTVTDCVCDNTRDAALRESGPTFKVKHTRYSKARLTAARDALAIVHTVAEDFAAEVADLCATTVNDKEWERFLTAYIPMDQPTGAPLSRRATALAEAKRDELQRLYRHDQRVTPWAGTAFGVIQATNTWENHYVPVRGTERSERNQLRSITGDFGRSDKAALAVLEKVLAS